MGKREDIEVVKRERALYSGCASSAASITRDDIYFHARATRTGNFMIILFYRVSRLYRSG